MLKMISEKGFKILKTPRCILRCERCNSILATLNAKEFEYIYLEALCNCGATPYLQMGDPNAFQSGDPPVRLYHKGGSYICQRCSVPLFSVTDSVINFSFRIVCNCGEKYNLRFD